MIPEPKAVFLPAAGKAHSLRWSNVLYCVLPAAGGFIRSGAALSRIVSCRKSGMALIRR